MCFISAMRISSYPHELPKGHYYCINVCVLGVSLLDKTKRKCCMHGKRHLPTVLIFIIDNIYQKKQSVKLTWNIVQFKSEQVRNV